MPRTALWTAIAETLTAEIAEGLRPPGQRLPSEAELARRFGVNRHTLRRALADLAARGLVHARRGAGVFVTARPLDYPLGRRTRFHANLTASGRLPSRRVLAIETRPCDSAEAEALGLDPGAMVHVFDGVSLADGVAVALFRSVFPAARFPALAEALGRWASVTRALQEAGLADYTRAQTKVMARNADAGQALHLQLREGAALLGTQSVNIDAEGRPVEYGVTWFAAERVVLSVQPS